MQSSIEGYLRLLTCEHFLSASTTEATVAVAFFVTTGNRYRYQLVYTNQATRIDAGTTSNFARMATDATKRKHYCKCKHFLTLSLAWLSLGWPQCKPAFTLKGYVRFDDILPGKEILRVI